ncbi:DUF4136 domain-containing protein [Pleomorphovibrio marinus]|uniref:DUF4136 domain-containing protein n=1 Tax=Pleomorphovibrio marinus TaxID=2164132 RepID=UPI000E0B4405|nr:DUF4136 domain-containing protein [Pleomorphovibrio marinus]
MKNLVKLGIAMVIVVIGACNPVKVYLEKNEVASIDSYKTFYVINEFYDKYAFNSPVLEENLNHSLTEGMKRFGLELDEKQPDLILRYNTILTDKKKEVNTMPMSPWGWGMNPWMWGPWGMPGGRGGYRVEKYDLGELVVDFIDTRNDKVVMRISAVGEINKPEQKSKNLKASVNKILSEFSKNIPT